MVLKIVSIILKIVEITILGAATGLVGFFTKEYRDYVTDLLEKGGTDFRDPYDLGYYGRAEFFLYTTGVGIIIAIVGLLAVITGLFEKKEGFAMAIVNGLWILQLLVSTSLVARVLATSEEKLNDQPSLCDNFDTLDTDFQCNQVIGGLVCSFIGAIVFIVDAIVSFIASRSQSA